MENGALRAQQQTGQVRLPGVTRNTPAATAVNNTSAALASVSANVSYGGKRHSLPSSSNYYFVFEGEYRSGACRNGMLWL